jgi:KDO2-lipid IV(A) lauroyltransferase
VPRLPLDRQSRVTLFLRLVACLPLPILHGLGILLGWVVYLAPGRHSERMRTNIYSSGLCKDARACRRLLRQSIGESGKAIMEVIVFWLRPYEKAMKLVKGTTGWEHIEAALADGKGLILFGPHLGGFEIASQYYAQYHPFTAMYKPPRNPKLGKLMLAGRQRGLCKLVPADKSGVRALLDALRRGEGIGMLPDQVASKGDGVWAPFFGRPAFTPTLVASLQRKTGAAGFFGAAERLPWGRGFHIHILPMHTALPEDKAAAAALINQYSEEMIRRFPAQYLWIYNRYKRPGGAPPPPDAAS